MLASIVLAAPLLAGGCGKAGPERIPVVPVDGAVTFDGKPVPGAMIVLHPKYSNPKTSPWQVNVPESAMRLSPVQLRR
jgi:hypothetical protein